MKHIEYILFIAVFLVTSCVSCTPENIDRNIDKVEDSYKDFEADVYFPEIDENIWETKRLSPMLFDKKENVNFRFEVWERK